MNHEPKLQSQNSKTPAHHWWRGFFVLFTVFSLYQLLRHDFSGHFRTFEEAARRLHNGVTPYGTDFGIGVGRFFYSPAAALYFYRFFLPLPEKLGLALYATLSVAVFFWGTALFLKPYKNRTPWLLILALPQVYAALIAAKLELIMMGILFACISIIQKNPKSKIAPFFLAMPIAWKYQPLPIFGLMAISALLLGQYTLIFYGLLGLLFWALIPAAELGVSFYVEILKQMQSSLSEFTSQAYASFDNLFATFHMPLNGFIYLVILGALSACASIIYFIKTQKISWNESIEMAFVLGSAYIVLLSPLQQNNAYILWLPILFAAGTRLNFQSRFETIAFFFMWILIALGYSDLMPALVRVPFREHALKPLFTLFFTTFTFLGVIPNARRRLESKSSH